MYAYLKHNEVNKKLWDECIENAKNGIIYAMSWYLDITNPGWEAIVQAKGEKYNIVMPVPVSRKFMVKYVNQPVFTQQLGIFSKEIVKNEDFIEILGILKRRFRYIQRYEFNTGNTEVLNLPSSPFCTKTFYTHYLDLNRSYQEIVSAYKSDRKWRINKAKRSDILIEETDDIESLIAIFDKNVAPKIYGIIGEKYEYKILRELYYAARKRGLTRFLSAHDRRGNVLAMGLFFNFNSKIIYIFNASTPQGKRLSAISLVVDKILKDNSNKPLCFDFESPEVPKVAEFYWRFGAEATPFASISHNNLPEILKLIKGARFYLYRRFIKAPQSDQYQA